MSEHRQETLLQALKALERRRKISHIWRSGMRVIDEQGLGGRIILANKRGIQLMEWEQGHGRRTWHVDQIPNWRIDIHDAATQGVLRSMIAEVMWVDDDLHVKGDSVEEQQRRLGYLLCGFLLELAEKEA